MQLQIMQVGHPVLRSPARDVPSEMIGTPGLATLIDLMRETMRAAPGVGLAAPQIGEGLRLAVIEDRAEAIAALPPEEVAARQRQPVPFHVIINPRLTVVDAAPAVFMEGCLSVQGFVARVPRALAVRVEALDHNGAPVTIEAGGWYARILQHEIDHLNGLLYLDHMDPRSFARVEAYQRYGPIPAIPA